MLAAEQTIREMLINPVRKIRGRVEILEGSTLLEICKCGDALRELTIERVGDSSKLFGFGIVQKLNVKIIDKDRARALSTANTLDVALGAGSDYIHPFPYFFISRVNRDEKTNELSITAYDALYQATEHKISEVLDMLKTYTLGELANACAAMLGLTVVLDSSVEDSVFTTDYPEGANISGNETFREILDAIAEATQTIYFIDSMGYLLFKRLLPTGRSVLTINKKDYFELDMGDNRRLAAITHTTELGDNLTAKMEYTGTTQYIRENPFYTMRDDTATMLDNALSIMGGFTISQFNIKWRGNFLLEIGDRISIEDKTGAINKNCFLLDDVITYNGALSQSTQWKYTGDDAQTETNLTTIGDKLKNTYARVDKANQEILLVANAGEENRNNIASLQLNTESISASVDSVKAATEEALSEVNDSIGTLTNKVEAQITSEDVSISIQSALANGVDKVTTETGFTFNADGLTITKTESEISTQITEDGMTVARGSENVLTANNEGVEARNLNAITYLIIGLNSRLENYGSDRTGCFWIGG